ncbi:hypothetical protein HYC85_010707 [Camellia sinensis]|uniref:Uncharacterized protein n=1 Tax=Camellia sinensis TaxID=4442 RepID=A0A7J7HIT9_CAMSI|nr:hypothetical protein HYC85_010707 [Camellia sinensis]
MVFKMSFFTEKDWSSETLWNFDDIAPFIQAHLFKAIHFSIYCSKVSPNIHDFLVYFVLFCTLMASAFGVQCHVYCNTGGIITTFGFIGSMWWLFLTSPWKEFLFFVTNAYSKCRGFVTFLNEQKRRAFLLMFAALCGGASIGPLLELVKIDPGKIIIAFVGSAIGFVSFSLAAMSSQNRARFYLLGLFSSDLLNLIWLLRASTYGGYSALFMGIIVQARCGDVYYVHHALTFFTDFPAVVIGLIRNKKKLPVPPSEEQERRRGGRSRL